MKAELEFALLNAGNLFCCLGFSLIAPFYPAYAKEYDVSNSILGLIFGMNPIGGMLASLIIGKLLNNSNQKTFLYLGLIIQAIGQFQFPLLSCVHQYEYFLTLSFIGRFLSGFGGCTFLTPFYAYIPQKFPETAAQKMAIIEFFSSFGYLAGAVAGSILYEIGGFYFPFLIFGSASIFIALIIKFGFQENNQILTEKQQQIQKDNQIGYFTILKDFSVLAQFNVIFSMCLAYSYFQPIFAIFFQDQFDVPPVDSGYYMSLAPFSYCLGAILISRIKVHKQIAILIGIGVVAISEFLMGPDPLLGIRPQLHLTMIAYLIFGFFIALPYVLTLPSITESLELRFEKKDHEKCICLASGLFNSILSIGEQLGPFLSGLIAEHLEFPRSCSILGIYLIMSTVLYIPNVFQNKFKAQRAKVQNFDEQL
ncbi:unnamed protein product [Paramecium octaurelia]|uniref:Major facilitator superfamily (MFS) profile domain-containing protein n=1 Tax=Paramecium octaurelia TaxID=43137 RepID=A0A8S1XUD7_PAROT|nr:unnamed protein product [Paramecium octaurelia]